ncbi:MAG: hypothetical protein E7301_04940 [Butyrivibrio sp.]|nr:hypothetical protein [Butyrivibrio sp.]
MTIYANSGDEREVGEYSTYVKVVRDESLTDDMIIAVLKIKPQTISDIRYVISQHPDWDDDVAEEVLDMQDKAYV